MSGILASFETERALRGALERLRNSGLSRLETYTPVALDEHPSGSPIPAIMFAVGLLGFLAFFALMAYADMVSYPVDVGGRPRFAWPAFIPIAFELGILCAMVAGFVAFFFAGPLLRLHAPVDECAGFRAASRDGWMVMVQETNPGRLAAARAALRELAPTLVEDVP
jgi:hypothetical protein